MWPSEHLTLTLTPLFTIELVLAGVPPRSEKYFKGYFGIKRLIKAALCVEQFPPPLTKSYGANETLNLFLSDMFRLHRG